MLDIREFTNQIMFSKLQAVISNNPIKNLLAVVSTLQAHPFYAEQDIMSQVSDCQDRDCLNIYILDKLSNLCKNV